MMLGIAIALCFVHRAYRLGYGRGLAAGVKCRPAPVYRKLTCFGGPLDGQSITLSDDVNKLHVPEVVREPKAEWHDGDPVGRLAHFSALFRQTTYLRLWMNDREQLVYQNTNG